MFNEFTEGDEPSFREWGEEFILFNPDNPSGSWVSIPEDDLIDLDDIA